MTAGRNFFGLLGIGLQARQSAEQKRVEYCGKAVFLSTGGWLVANRQLFRGGVQKMRATSRRRRVAVRGSRQTSR